MKNFLREWLGINASIIMVCERAADAENRILSLEQEFNSREACKICGKHRYNKIPQYFSSGAPRLDKHDAPDYEEESEG